MEFDNYLDYMLQQDATFYIKNKVYRKGRILLYTVKDFYVYFMIKDGESIKHFELPLPFDIRKDGRNIDFDYTFKTLSHNNDELYYKLKSTNKVKTSKIYDVVMKIIIN